MTGCGWSAERAPQRQAHSSSPTGTPPGTRCPCLTTAQDMTGAQNQCQDSVATGGASCLHAKSHTWDSLAQPMWFLKVKKYGLTFLEKLGQTKPLGQLVPTAPKQIPLPSAHGHLDGCWLCPGPLPGLPQSQIPTDDREEASLIQTLNKRSNFDSPTNMVNSTHDHTQRHVTARSKPFQNDVHR